MRRRILLLVVGMTVLVVLAFAIPLAILIRHNAYDDGQDALRRESTDVALYLRRTNADTDPAQLRRYLDGLDSNRSASVETPGATVIGHAPPGSADDLPAAPSFGRGQPRGFGGDSDDGNSGGGGPGGGPPQAQLVAYRGGLLAQLQVPTFDRNDGLYTVRVWASDDVLREGQTGPWLLLAGAAVLLVVVGVGAGEVLTRRIVRPLVDTSATATRLAAGDTSARAPTRGPAEVADVGHALNRLADRIDELIAEERETVADLSHRLRTPMTALRLDAEALPDTADAERIGSHVSALERMLTSVIHAARRPQREGRMPSSDATAVVADRVEFWSALAEDQRRAMTVELPDGPITVRTATEDLAAAVDALLENVIAHTPEGTPFTVRLAGVDAGARLTVSDDGPGLPPDASVRGRSDRGSSGLGLSIARRCAAASGGELVLGASPSGGALVTMDLHGA